MRLGMNIQYLGKDYDILELPLEAFLPLLPGLRPRSYHQIERCFKLIWSDDTVLRRHILDFAALHAGTTIDSLVLSHDHIHFDENDLNAYIEEHSKRGCHLS